jgi:FlaA1/EpsC-like NDP-sugar epimerase
MRIRNRYLVVLDIALLGVAPFLLYAARFEGWQWGEVHRLTAIRYTLVSVPVCIVIFFFAGMYRRLWRYASTAELRLIFLAGGTAALVCVALGGFLLPATGLTPVRVPLSVLVTSVFAVIGSVAVPRLLMRLAPRRGSRVSAGVRQRRVLIAGAGTAGQMIIRELTTHPELGLQPVGIVDDDASKHGHRLANVLVLGGIGQIPDIARARNAEMLIIAMPSAAGSTLRQVVRAALDAGLDTRTVPGLSEIIAGQVSIASLRQVQIEDLLRREPIQTDLAAVSSLIADRVVLVTGAGGSIGGELCRQLAQLDPAKLVLVGHGENSIFHIVQELQRSYPGLVLAPVIADVRDANRIDHVFDLHRPAIVFHAAAHKHVPLMEENVVEAVTNNVGGTANVVGAAVRHGTKHFVMISTDKAVRPSNVLGATKRVAEHVVRAAAGKHNRNFVAVRFGNVLGSRGSVVPTFVEQIRNGGPVTVTHKEVRRYFMTIPEAVQLVLQAATIGHGGDLFMLDMGELVRVSDLAREMIRLSGLEPDSDIEIRYTGLRPGEKLYEEMFSEHETAEPTEHPKILRTRSNLAIDHGGAIAALVQSAQRGDSAADLRGQLKALVPDFDFSHAPAKSISGSPSARGREKPAGKSVLGGKSSGNGVRAGEHS